MWYSPVTLCKWWSKYKHGVWVWNHCLAIAFASPLTQCLSLASMQTLRVNKAFQSREDKHERRFEPVLSVTWRGTLPEKAECHLRNLRNMMLLNTRVIQKSLNFLLIAMNLCNHFYQPPTELREGNVFGVVCPSTGGVHYPWCIGPHCTGSSPPGAHLDYQTWDPSCSRNET